MISGTLRVVFSFTQFPNYMANCQPSTSKQEPSQGSNLPDTWWGLNVLTGTTVSPPDLFLSVSVRFAECLLSCLDAILLLT